MKAQKQHSHFAGLGAIGFALLAMILLSSCQGESRGFVLPEGDEATGKQVFLDLNCDRCHSIDDIKWSGTEMNGDPYVKLGGQVTTIKTYGELVTSVINPSHKIERKSLNEEKVTLTSDMSKMELYRYNEVMTVQELIDLVAYLQGQYRVVEPYNPYTYDGF